MSMIRKPAILFSILPLLVLAIAVAFTSLGTAKSDAVDPPPPDGLSVASNPETMDLTARWRPVAEASSYKVHWRQRGDVEFSAENRVVVTNTAASFTVSHQGIWVVRVESCNESGCGRGANETASVIINTHYHPAVRVWQENSDNLEVEWDALPGYYVLSYRSKGEHEFVISEPLSTIKHSIPLSNFNGDPIIRVQFNCNEFGKKCAPLGRFPYTFLPPAPPSPDSLLLTPPSQHGAIGQSSLDSTTASPSDTVEKCTERASENDWERWYNGSTVKECSYAYTEISPQQSNSEASGTSNDPAEEFICTSHKRVNRKLILGLQAETWIQINYCYNSVDRIRSYRVHSAGAKLAEDTFPHSFVNTKHCGWLIRQSPIDPYTHTWTYVNDWTEEGRTLTLPHAFGGWVQAKFATIASHEPTSKSPCGDATARIDYLAAGWRVNWGGAEKVWGNG